MELKIIQSPSPNFTKGRSGYKPEAIVIHCTEGHFPSDLEWLRNPVSQVSAHYVISPTGEVHYLVAEDNTAWHAGKVVNPTWQGLKKNFWGQYTNPNLYTLSIEVSLTPPAIMPDAQKIALTALVSMLADKYAIPKDRLHIIGHHEIRFDKSCPGTIDVDVLVKDLNMPVSLPLSVSMNSAGTVDKDALKRQIINLIKEL